VRIVLEVVEGHELNDVCSGINAERIGIQSLIITIKRVHVAKVCITNSYDDDSEWKLRTSDDLVNCLIHVIDDPISNQQKD